MSCCCNGASKLTKVWYAASTSSRVSVLGLWSLLPAWCVWWEGGVRGGGLLSAYVWKVAGSDENGGLRCA